MDSAIRSGAPSLLLVPTELEAQRLADLGGLEPGYALSGLCGFGPVAAAARSAQLLSVLRPARVLLVGIAGTYDERLCPVGSAVSFTRVALEGVGAGEGASFQGPPALGFPQWPGSGDTPVVHQELRLAAAPATAPALLLSTCAASDSPEHARIRREHFPAAVAEDMEGFGVAMACALHSTPLAIVRGISNVVGERDPSAWRIPAALKAVRGLLQEVLESSWELA